MTHSQSLTPTFQVAADLDDAVAVQMQHFEAQELWKTLQTHNGIVREVDAVELVLSETEGAGGVWVMGKGQG